jgi:hypothetical protein
MTTSHSQSYRVNINVWKIALTALRIGKYSLLRTGLPATLCAKRNDSRCNSLWLSVVRVSVPPVQSAVRLQAVIVITSNNDSSCCLRKVGGHVQSHTASQPGRSSSNSIPLFVLRYSFLYFFLYATARIELKVLENYAMYVYLFICNLFNDASTVT